MRHLQPAAAHLPAAAAPWRRVAARWLLLQFIALPRANACRDASATIASGSYVSKGSLVGRGSTVDAGARLDRCVVGSECHIGRSAALQGSCLHSRVRVDDGCTVSAALLGEQTVLRSHAKVEVRLPALGKPLLHCCLVCRCMLEGPQGVHSSGRAHSTISSSLPLGLQTGAVLGKHTVVDTAHCVPAGACVSLVQPRSKDEEADSEDDAEWGDAGA